MSRLSIDMKNPIFYKYEIRRGECQLIVLDRHRRYATMWPPHFAFEEYFIFSGMAVGGGESTWPYCLATGKRIIRLSEPLTGPINILAQFLIGRLQESHLNEIEYRVPSNGFCPRETPQAVH
jgi:hypothetical protein